MFRPSQLHSVPRKILRRINAVCLQLAQKQYPTPARRITLLRLTVTLQTREPSHTMTPQKIRKAVFPAAGLGTRFLPATKAMPKEMLCLVDKPLIQYGVEEAVAAGCNEIIIITGRGKSTMEDHFGRQPGT